jgi:hypothetical protein
MALILLVIVFLLVAWLALLSARYEQLQEAWRQREIQIAAMMSALGEMQSQVDHARQLEDSAE